MTTPDLVGPAIRSAIERFAQHVVKNDIHRAWEGAGFPHTEADPAARPERVSLFKAYCAAVSWSDRTQTSAALYAFRELINDAAAELEVATDLYGEQTWKGFLERLRQAVERKHLVIDNEYLIHLPSSVGLADEVWDGLSNADTVLEHLNRLQNAIKDEDPSLVIGLSKELTESAAKIVLTELNVTYTTKDSLPALVNKVRDALKLHHLDIPGTDATPEAERAAKGINKALSGAANVVVGLDEFRNAAGTGHGRLRTVQGLGSRHSRLAVDAAALWCNLVFSTLADERAPWRNSS